MQLGRCYVMWTGKKDRGLGSLFLQGDTIFSRWTNSSITWIINPIDILFRFQKCVHVTMFVTEKELTLSGQGTVVHKYLLQILG